jgi:uncharacterized protein
MSPNFHTRLIAAALVVGTVGAIALPALPAAAQFGSTGYQFLEAVRERDGTKVTELLGEAAGTLINTRDTSTGQTALHIVTDRRDTVWLRFLLARRADPNLADRAGTTPLYIATQIGFIDGARALIEGGARINQTNGRGETALHIAVQRRDLAMVRALIAAGADPDVQDNVTGQSPRDYAASDNRAATIVAALDDRPSAAPSAPRPAGPN